MYCIVQNGAGTIHPRLLAPSLQVIYQEAYCLTSKRCSSLLEHSLAVLFGAADSLSPESGCTIVDIWLSIIVLLCQAPGAIPHTCGRKKLATYQIIGKKGSASNPHVVPHASTNSQESGLYAREALL